MSTPPPKRRRRGTNLTEAAVKVLAEYPSPAGATAGKCLVNGCEILNVGDAPAVAAFNGAEYTDKAVGEFSVRVAEHCERVPIECVDQLNAIGIVLFLQYDLLGRWAPLVQRTLKLFSPLQRASLGMFAQCSCTRETVAALQECGVTELVLEHLGGAALRVGMYSTHVEALRSGVGPAEVVGSLPSTRRNNSILVIDNKVTERPRIVIIDAPEVVQALIPCVHPVLFAEHCCAESDASLGCDLHIGQSGWAGQKVMQALSASLDRHSRTMDTWRRLKEAHAAHTEAVRALYSAEAELDTVRDLLKRSERTRSEKAMNRERSRFRASQISDELCIKGQIRRALEELRCFTVVANVLCDVQLLADAITDSLLANQAQGEVMETVLRSVRTTTRVVHETELPNLVSLKGTAQDRLVEARARVLDF